MSGRELGEWQAFFTIENQIAAAIRQHTSPEFAYEMAWTPRPGETED